MKTRRTIVITMGDPKGIGPEVIVKALGSQDIRKLLPEFRFMVIGSSEVLAQTARTLKADFNPIPVSQPEMMTGATGDIFIHEPADKSRNGLDYILAAIEAMSSKGLYKRLAVASGSPPERVIRAGASGGKPNPNAALVTGPVSKETINKTGFNFIGHTELLAQKTLSRKVTMMFAAPQLKVSLVTTHIAYKKVLLYLTADRIFSTIEQTDTGLRKYFNVAQPRIAVCGLNPHAGEGRAFGNEESRIIEPAIKLARARKINCAGPFPPDSIFHRAIQGEFDAVVTLYHDQGLIPLKTMAFSEAVQVTLGLPFIRTSPAHGVAYDIAGQGAANPASMIEAVKLAASMGHQGGSLFDDD